MLPARKPIALLVSALLLAGCGTEPWGEYNLPLAEAYSRLSSADVDGFRMTRGCGVIVHFKPRKDFNESIEWHVLSDNYDMLQFTVRLTALDAKRTQATIEIPPDTRGGELYDGNKFYPYPALNQPLRKGVQELVDAAMAQRPFEVERAIEPGTGDDICTLQGASLEFGKPFKVTDEHGDPFLGRDDAASAAWKAAHSSRAR